MSIADNYAPTKTLGNGVTTIFTFPWKGISTEFVKVYSQNVSTGVITEITTGITKALNANEIGGTVTFATAPASTVYIIIARVTPKAQTDPYTTSTGFPAKTVESNFDKLVAMLQESVESLLRSIKYPLGTDITALGISTTIPLPSALKSLRWNALATALENYTPTATELDYDGNIAYGVDASKAAVPSTGDIYVALDTETFYICFTAGVWSTIAPDGSLFVNLEDIPSAAGRIPFANLPLAPTVVTLTDAATIATDASLGGMVSHFKVTLGGNRTLGNPTNPTDGQRAVWEFIQDGTGSRTITLGSDFIFGTDVTSITLTTTASKRDFMCAIYRNSKWEVVGFARGYA